MHIQSRSIVRTLYSSIIQGYLGIFRDIDAYSATHTGPQLGEEERPPLNFLKIEKSVLILERKDLIVSILGLNFQFKI